MRKTKIEWCTMTWNPVTGCLHGCEYCYARKIAQRFGGYSKELQSEYETPIQVFASCGVIAALDSPLLRHTTWGEAIAPYPFEFDPTFYRYKLNEPQQVKKSQNIFVCSMADLFGEWVPIEWIEGVLKACYQASQHRYLFLTKNPDRYADAVEYLESRMPECAADDNPPEMWFGATVDSNRALWDAYESEATWLSIEPILEEISVDECFIAYRRGDEAEVPRWHWVVIGAETGNRKGKVVPQRSWIEEIVKECDANGIPVFMKDSLIPIVGEAAMRREFPWDKEVQNG